MSTTTGQQLLINGGSTPKSRRWTNGAREGLGGEGSDVNLGVDLSWDAAAGGIHTALVVSNDLDLQRAV